MFYPETSHNPYPDLVPGFPVSYNESRGQFTTGQEETYDITPFKPKASHIIQQQQARTDIKQAMIPYVLFCFNRLIY